MKLLYLALSTILLSYCTTTASSAGEIEGVVVMVGSAPNARPVIEPNGPKSQHEICPGDEQNYLRRFGGTFVKANGDWGQTSATKERCFTIKSFSVVQLTKGRPAFTGDLVKDKDGNLTLNSQDGKKMTLEQAPKAVSALAGKKVIMDLLPSNKIAPGGSDPLWKVVSFMEYPSR